MTAQALGLQRKIQNQRHSGPNLPFLPVLLCTTSYLIILSVRGRKDNKCVEERTDVQVPPWALMCGVHCRHPTAAHWGHLLASLGSWFSLEGLTRFVHQWDRQVSYLTYPAVAILGTFWNSGNSLGCCRELGWDGSQFCLAFWLTAKHSLPSYLFFKARPKRPDSAWYFLDGIDKI